MALLKYLKASKDGLPDPKGSLLSAIPSQAIAQAKREVKQLLSHAIKGSEYLIKVTSILVNLF